MKREIEEIDNIIFSLIERSAVEREFAYNARDLYLDAVAFEKVYYEIEHKRFPRDMKDFLRCRVTYLYNESRRIALDTNAVPEMALNAISEFSLN